MSDNPTALELADELDAVIEHVEKHAHGPERLVNLTTLRILRAVLGFTSNTYLEIIDMAATLNDLKTTIDALTATVAQAVTLLKDVNPALVDTLNTQSVTAQQQLQAAVDAANPPATPPATPPAPPAA